MMGCLMHLYSRRPLIHDSMYIDIQTKEDSLSRRQGAQVSFQTNKWVFKVQMDRHILSLIYFFLTVISSPKQVSLKQPLHLQRQPTIVTSSGSSHTVYLVLGSHWREQDLGSEWPPPKFHPPYLILYLLTCLPDLFEPHHDHLEIFSSLFLSPTIYFSPFLFSLWLNINM